MTTDVGDKPKITALAPWFGAKRNLAAAIVGELGEHRVFWDLLCGSMAILLAKLPCVMETVNDLNGDLTNLALVIQDDVLGPKLYRKLRRTMMVEYVHRQAADRWKLRGYRHDGPADFDAAFDFFLCSWLGRNGVAGTNSYNQGFCLRFTANGGHAATRWSSAVDSIPAWRRRLRNVTILRRNCFDLLPRIDDAAGIAIYVDPPYVRKGAKYIHDFKPEDHPRLAKELSRFKRARVVVSYYDEPELDKWYAGWTKRKLKATKAARESRNARRRRGDGRARGTAVEWTKLRDRRVEVVLTTEDPMAISQICLDMDGVLCDFVSAALRAHGRDPDEIYATWPHGEYDIEKILGVTSEKFWQRITERGWNFWQQLKPYPWMRDLLSLCQQTAPTIICTSPARHPSSFKGKAVWMQDHLGKDFRDFLIGPRKHFCAKPGAVLIDDSDKNCFEFSSAGGHVVVFPRLWNAFHGLADDPMRCMKDWLDAIAN